jgi:hypothetical protein
LADVHKSPRSVVSASYRRVCWSIVRICPDKWSGSPRYHGALDDDYRERVSIVLRSFSDTGFAKFILTNLENCLQRLFKDSAIQSVIVHILLKRITCTLTKRTIGIWTQMANTAASAMAKPAVNIIYTACLPTYKLTIAATFVIFLKS